MLTYTEWLSRLIIPTPEPKPFKDVAFLWQWSDAALLEDIVLYSTGDKQQSRYRHACFIRPRGYDKTSSIARLCLWAVCQKHTNLVKGYTCAVDEEQASLIAESAAEMLLLNDWLRKVVSIKRQKSLRIIGPGGVIRIMSSDDSSAWGKRLSLLIFDELTHWTTPKSKRFFTAMFSTLPKNPRAACIIISNAGHVGTWQHKLVDTISKDPSWYVYNQPGRLPSWVSEDMLAVAASGMDEGEVRRVFYNEWQETASFNLSSLYLKCPTRSETTVGDAYTHYGIGADYGYADSLSAITVCHYENDTVVVDTCKAFRGLSPNQFEQEVINLSKSFPYHTIYIDQYQMLNTIERLSQQGVNVYPVKPTQDKNKQMIGMVISLMIDGKIAFPVITGVCENESLASEISSLSVDNNGKLIGKTKDRFMSLCYAVSALQSKGVPLSTPINIPKLMVKMKQARQETPYGVHRDSQVWQHAQH